MNTNPSVLVEAEVGAVVYGMIRVHSCAFMAISEASRPVANQRENVIRADFDRLKATLTNCVRLGPDTQNRSAHPRFRSHLAGRVGFVESINPAKGRRLRAIFDKIQWQ